MEISGWGRFPRTEARIARCGSINDVEGFLKGQGQWIARGLGRSYGDSALADQVLDMTGMPRILDFQPGEGRITCEAGLPLGWLIDVILPHGWFLPVVPGTRHVTAGGAIAADVHGKNHHVDGCFGQWVESFELMLANGRVVTCSEMQNTDLFWATCGGMGLTGVILTATLRLKPVRSAFMTTRVVKASSLAQACDYFETFAEWPYLVAWIDCCSRGKDAGRSLVMMGGHSEDGELGREEGATLFSCPGFLTPFLNRGTVKIFNFLYYHWVGRRRDAFQIDVDRFFFPLDRVSNWNRLYGKNGLIQYQFVLPKESGIRGLSTVFDMIHRSGHIPFLAVLKLMGKQNASPLSFPMEGYTLALDFKNRAGLLPFLNRLDRLVCDYGGRIYLAKDARMPAWMVRAGYPRLDEFLRVRNAYDPAGRFCSLQAERLGLKATQ